MGSTDLEWECLVIPAVIAKLPYICLKMQSNDLIIIENFYYISRNVNFRLGKSGSRLVSNSKVVVFRQKGKLISLI